MTTLFGAGWMSRGPTGLGGAWPRVFLAASLLASATIRGHEPTFAASPEHAFAVRRLEARRVQQVQAAARYLAVHDFRFLDRVEESGIRFQHRIVEDAGRTYKAAHYDHGNGLALADVDGDGRVDVYFTTQLGTNQLWRNLGGGRFEDITVTAGVGMADRISVAPAFADMDNDGDPDLYVTTVRHGHALFENVGGGRFREITAEAGLAYSGHGSGAAWVDLDRDGLLDLVVTSVGSYTEEDLGPGGYHRARADAFQGHLYPARAERSLLYRNLGGRRFREASREWGFRDLAWTGDVTFADPNRDGFPDLYLVNMQGDDRYHENRNGQRFVERTAVLFPKTPWGAMGVKFFDVDQDGWVDLFVTDMHSDMTQPQTEKGLAFRLEAEKEKSDAFCRVQWPESYYQGSANNLFGNALHRGTGTNTFEEVSEPYGAETYWPWGVSVGDLNADGFEDVFVTAGMGYPFRYAINSVLLNEGGRRFVDAEFVLGVEPRRGGRTEKVWFTLDCGGKDSGHPSCGTNGFAGVTNVLGTLSSRSSAIADLDGDGDLDIVTNEFNDRPQLLLSTLAERRPPRFLQVRLRGTRSNRDGLGAKVEVRTGARTWTQWVDGKSGYLGQSILPLYFGLGEAERADELRVTWPSGQVQTVTDPMASGRTVEVVELPPDGERG